MQLAAQGRVFVLFKYDYIRYGYTYDLRPLICNMQIPINKEIRHYQEEIFLGLNLRQMICSGAAIAVAVAVYLGLTPLLGHETAGWVCIVAAAPIAAAGFFTYDCLTFEKFLLVVIDSTVIRNDWRLWKTENKYCKKKKGDKH